MERVVTIISQGSTLSAIFWGSMMLGRLFGIYIAKKITPTVYAYIDLVIASIVIILMGQSEFI